jgi:hypothetical protein
MHSYDESLVNAADAHAMEGKGTCSDPDCGRIARLELHPVEDRWVCADCIAAFVAHERALEAVTDAQVAAMEATLSAEYEAERAACEAFVKGIAEWKLNHDGFEFPADSEDDLRERAEMIRSATIEAMELLPANDDAFLSGACSVLEVVA